MKPDWYLRIVLSVIAAALVYLCIVFTPMPAVRAQGTRTPGEPTAPGEVVIVGWRTEPVPVQLIGRAEVTLANEVRIGGVVRTEQTPNSAARVIVSGWEDRASLAQPGSFTPFRADQQAGLPVRPMTPKP